MKRKNKMRLTLMSAGIWLCFIPAAILNGGLRDRFLVHAIGERYATPVSGILLCILILIIARLLLPRIGQLSGRERCLIGLSWTLMTIAFEFTFGLTAGNTLHELLAAYNPMSGNLWLLVVFTTFLSAFVGSRFSSPPSK